MSSFKILSLDGGGIRGAFAAACLTEFEKMLKRPLAEYFDLIAGTSTGAIIAAGLACGIRADQILDFYSSQGPRIFVQRGMIRRPLQFIGNVPFLGELRRYVWKPPLHWLTSKYGSEKLKKALENVFGQRLLGDVKQCRLIIPAVDLTRGSTVVFKTPHLDQYTRDRELRLVDVLCATTAAPTYFPHASIGNEAKYCDGGLWANNPGLAAYVEGRKIAEAIRTFNSEDISILAIGTGQANYSLEPPSGGPGLFWWSSRLFEVVTSSQMQGTHFQLQHLLGNRYHRLDFQVPNKQTWELDSIDVLSTLVHLGKEKAHHEFSAIKSLYFSSTCSPYS